MRVDKTDFALGAAIGMAVGAALGIFLAPASGAQARRFIVEKTQEGAEVLRELGDDDKWLR